MAWVEDADVDSKLFPFPDNLGDILSPTIFSSPRRLIKVCFYAISEAQGQLVPFSPEYVQEVEDKAFPSLGAESQQ